MHQIAESQTERDSVPFSKSFVVEHWQTIETPASCFSAQEVGPALLDLLTSCQPIPELQIKLQGQPSLLARLKLLRNQWQHDSETGHIQIVVRLPGSCAHCREGYRTLHFVPEGVTTDLPVDRIEYLIVGYPQFSSQVEIENKHLGIRFRQS